MNANFKFDYGDKVKDIIDGWAGVITGRCEYLNGCKQYRVAPTKLKKDGTCYEGIWIDEAQLVRAGASIKVAKKETGGPQDSPSGKM